MKKFLMMCCALALPALVLFSSCEKEDDAKTLAQSVEGTYPVDIRVSLTGTPSADDEAIDASVAITAASDNSVNMNLIGFQFGQQEIPISLAGITVSGSEGNVTLAYNGTINSEELTGFQNLTGTLTGTIEGGVMSMQLAINATPTMTINVTIDSK